MVRTIQRKITSIYSLWLFAVFLLIVLYNLLVREHVFMSYAEAMPWILLFIGLAVIGNIATLVAIYYYLNMNPEGMKWLAIYEVLFIVLFVVTYLVLAVQLLPESIGNMGFATILNAILPLVFIVLVFLEYVFSRGIRTLTPKPEYAYLGK
ncbi:MAG: hypothetical protein FWE54_03735 [Methanimicrococcus sp.]|nr:hypothetical protein [Methanimicrococcus sp.]